MGPGLASAPDDRPDGPGRLSRLGAAVGRLFTGYGWPAWVCLITFVGAWGQWRLEQLTRENARVIERTTASECVEDWEDVGDMRDFSEALIAQAEPDNPRVEPFREYIHELFPEPACNLGHAREVLGR